MDTVIISPSGNLYGSERVLLDFLRATKVRYYLFLPIKGLLHKEADKSNHLTLTYNSDNLFVFYLRLLFFMLFHRVGKVYLNEGGHIRYVKLLSSFMPWVIFNIHIRIIEDTTQQRIGKLRKNIQLITISSFLESELSKNNYKQVVKINDPYRFSETKIMKKLKKSSMSISIIGRFTQSKGSELVSEFFSFIDDKIKINIELNIFGNIEKSKEIENGITTLEGLKNTRLLLHGFIDNTDEIYSSSDVIMHFNAKEPLGRIFLESIDSLIPFIGFDSGGIKEIAGYTGLSNQMVLFDDSWKENMLRVLIYIIENRNLLSSTLKEAKNKAKKIYSIDRYIHELENLIA